MQEPDPVVPARCAIHLDRAAELTCARCGSFACYECVGAADAGVCARCRLRTGGDRAGQLRVLAILTIINGVLLTLAGSVCTLMFPMFAFLPAERGGVEVTTLPEAVFVGCAGLLHLVPGILQIIAGLRLRKMRGRTFALLAYGAGVLTFFGIYCAPTSLGVGIFGAILLFDRQVRLALDRDDAV